MYYISISRRMTSARNKKIESLEICRVWREIQTKVSQERRKNRRNTYDRLKNMKSNTAKVSNKHILQKELLVALSSTVLEHV